MPAGLLYRPPQGIAYHARRRAAAKRIQARFRGARVRRMSSLNRRIKRISLKQSETKMSNQKEVSNTLFHNLTHYYPNLLATGQGVTDPIGTSQDSRNRVGSDVKGVGIRIKNQIISAVGRPNCNYIIYIFWYRSNETLNDANFWSGPSGAGATNNRFLDHPKPGSNLFKVVKKMIVQNLNNYANVDDKVHTHYREVYIPLKFRNIRYNQDSETPDPWTLGMCVTAFDANNTGQTDALAYSSFASTFYFKDP